MASGSSINGLVTEILAAVVGFGLALYIGYTFFNALPAGSASANSVNAILLVGAGIEITTVFVPIVALLFIFYLYNKVKKQGIIGKGSGE